MKKFLNSTTLKCMSLAGLLLLNIECGVTVGNAGPPSVASGDDELGQVVGMQLDEAMNASGDQSSSDASTDTALVERSWLLAADDTSTCTEDATAGTAKVEGRISSDLTVEVGKAAKRRLITDVTTREFGVTFSQVIAATAILCSDKGRPILSWAQLINLKTIDRLTKTRKRTVVLKADNSTLRSSTLTATTNRTNTFSKDLLSLTALTYSKSSSFDSSVELTDGDTTRKHGVKTLENEPIVLQRSLKRGTGLTEAKIVSGSTQSSKADGKVVILHYKNLQLSLGDSCLPTSGSVSGEIYADDTATKPEQTLVVTFSENGAVLAVDGGSEMDIDLETCKL